MKKTIIVLVKECEISIEILTSFSFVLEVVSDIKEGEDIWQILTNDPQKLIKALYG